MTPMNDVIRLMAQAIVEAEFPTAPAGTRFWDILSDDTREGYMKLVRAALAAAEAAGYVLVDKRIIDAIEMEKNAVERYEQAHADLEDGKQWAEINNGATVTMSYEGWLAYMQQRFTLKIKSLVHLAAAAPRWEP